MRSIKRMAIFPAVIATCGLVAGCFSYHKNVEETRTPAVVETTPPVVETVPAPVVAVPAPVTSSTTTTTTDTSPTVVERQKTTTYTTTPY